MTHTERLREPHTDPDERERPEAVAAVAPPSPARSPTLSEVLRMQRAAGNRAVGQLLRDPPAVAPAAPKTDEEQWEADWNDPAFARARGHFAGPDRPVGTPRERYDVLCPLYKAHGIARPLKYVQDNIVWSDFFGHGTPMHKDLKTALKKAEKTLKDAGVTDAPFTKCWAFNPRTQTGGQWSNHADGKAIDIDEATNPRLLKKGHRDVITALTEMDIGAANPGAAEGLDSYDASKQASESFQERYSVEGMTERIDELTGEEAELAAEGKELEGELEGELAGVPTGKKASKADVTKAKEIKARLKAKQAEIKAKAAMRKTLEKERKRFEGLDAAVEQLEAAIAKLEGEIDQLNGEVEKLGKGESLEAGKPAPTGKALAKQIKAKKTAIATKATAIKKKQKQLEKAVEARDTDTLRGYADVGFLDLDKDMVEALKAAGLGWGGDYKGAKDYMHFEVK